MTTANTEELRKAMSEELGGVDVGESFDRLFGPTEQAQQPAEQAQQPAEQVQQPAEQAQQPAEQAQQPAEKQDPPSPPETDWKAQYEAERAKNNANEVNARIAADDAARVKAIEQAAQARYNELIDPNGANFSPEAAQAMAVHYRDTLMADAEYVKREQTKVALAFQIAEREGLSVAQARELATARNPQEFQEIVNKHVSTITPREREQQARIEALEREVAEVKKGQAPPQQFGGLQNGINQNAGNSFKDIMHRISNEDGYYDSLSPQVKQDLFDLL